MTISSVSETDYLMVSIVMYTMQCNLWIEDTTTTSLIQVLAIWYSVSVCILEVGSGGAFSVFGQAHTGISTNV